MLNLGDISFASPWLLGFLAALPVLWWLLRLTPPAPRKIIFPALSLLAGLKGQEETPAHTPWWLLLLRLLIMSLLIVAFANPVLNPLKTAAPDGDLLLVVDNDWASARDWEERHAALHDIVARAVSEKRKTYVLSTAPDAKGEELSVAGPLAAEAALAMVDQITPEPWPADWDKAAKLVTHIPAGDVGDVVWFASGLGNTDATLLYAALRKIAPTKTYGTSTPIYSLEPPVSAGDELSMAVKRTPTDAAANLIVDAIAKDGNSLAHWEASFSAGAPRAAVPLKMPPELRNRVARFEVLGQPTAAATVLLDAAWEHHAVGIVGDAAELDRHSLLSEIYYIDRAVKPFATVKAASLDELMKDDLAVIIMPDEAAVNDADTEALTDWLKRGGVLVRFAGDRFAATVGDDKTASLLPVALRSGDRSMGGALTWSAPQKLQAFPENSPFHGLTVPDDVLINRQVLAEPSSDLAAKTWASLSDGTPLVTASSMGQGMSVLFHVPARASWSNLPLSGLFVEMLQRISQLSQSGHKREGAPTPMLKPLKVMDAFGELHEPSSAAMPINHDDIASVKISPQHPPGLYGAEADSYAFNLGPEIGQPESLRDVPIEAYASKNNQTDLQPTLIVAAFLLLLLDALISLRMRGFLKLATLLFLVAIHASPAQAETSVPAVELTSKTYLAYVHTGDAGLDRISELGLRGLAGFIQERTSIDEIGVARVDPDTDDLAYFPLLYWPVVPNEPALSAEGARRVSYYLHHGGMILFDAGGSDVPAQNILQRVLRGVDMPPLQPLPEKHVLKRTFYLLDDFPGRFAGQDFWLEPENASAYDGVATVLFGSNGWAAAWAVDEKGNALFPCIPDGEKQREKAYRFGLNLVMYALTGNYKNDQLHTSALLKRMGK